MRQSSAFDPTTVGNIPTSVGERVAAFLRTLHPVKPALAVAATTGAVTPAQAEKWFARTSAPSGPALLALIRSYGPEFLAAIFDDAPAWVREAERAEKQAALERQLAETRAMLDALNEIQIDRSHA